MSYVAARREQITEFVSRFDTIPVHADQSTGESDYYDGRDDLVAIALEDAQSAVERVQSGARKVALPPQSAYVRRLQHGLAAKYNVGSASAGREPKRHVVIRRRRK